MTKYLLVIAVVVLVLWWLRRERLERQADNAQAKAKSGGRNSQTPHPALPTRMVRCAYCGTHLPESEAVKGGQGHYCDHDHRQRREG